MTAIDVAQTLGLSLGLFVILYLVKMVTTLYARVHRLEVIDTRERRKEMGL